MTADKRFVKNVAQELERRKRNRRMIFLGVWAAIIILAVIYVRCGNGWGVGGKGKGSGGTAPGTGTLVATADAGPARCAIRVSSSGITVDGKPMDRDAAIATCSKTTGADVVITGDAREGDWKDLEAGLQAAKITVFQRTTTP